MNTPVIFFCGVLAALLAAVLVFAGIYFTRIQTLNSIEKLTGYADGFNLYHMDVRYSYSLDDMMSYGVRDNQTMINVISKAALPFFPVKIQAPEFGCTAFTLTDRNGAVHMDAIMISGIILLRCSSAALRKTAINPWPMQHWTMFLQTCRKKA